MNLYTKKNSITMLDNYLYNSSINQQNMMKITHAQKTKSILDYQIKLNESSVPTIYTYNNLIFKKYSISQLKDFCKKYQLKVGGNKTTLTNRLYCYLYTCNYAVIIQKYFRKFLVKKYKLLHGPASVTRNICTNNVDFVSMEPLTEINYHQFISYKDVDDFVYGFDITSLHNLSLKANGERRNPYNRNLIPDMLFNNIRNLIRLSKILNIKINLNIEDDSAHISIQKAFELRSLTLFQNIDSLGNYSNVKWFLSLTRQELLNFVKELIDIWNYRAQLTIQTKQNICPPFGNPFGNLSLTYITMEENLLSVKKIILEIMEKFVNSGIDKDSKTLGAYYVLGALTLVNHDAAYSLPWLFNSLNYY